MLRINLLPPYINEGKVRKRWMVIWPVIILLCACGMAAWALNLGKEAKRIAAETDALRPTKAKAESIAQQANQINTESADIRGKVDFVSKAIKYDQDTYPSLFHHVTTYTLRNVMYDSINPQGNTVTMSAYARTLADVAHYIMAMERNKEITNVSIQIGSIPGFPVTPGFNSAAGGQGVRPSDGHGHNFTVTLSLVTPIPGGPTFGNAAPAAAPGAPGGMGSMGMGSMGSMGGRSGMGYSSSGGYSSYGGSAGYARPSGGSMSGGSPGYIPPPTSGNGPAAMGPAASPGGPMHTPGAVRPMGGN